MFGRVLCLGNELLADDAFGQLVADRLHSWAPPEVDVVFSANTGFSLIDYLTDVDRLVVVDTLLGGGGEPGTLRVVREGEVVTTPGSSPHYIGLFEALAAVRVLGMPAPREMVILVVEAADCTTVGGTMHPAVARAVPNAVARVQGFLSAANGKDLRVS